MKSGGIKKSIFGSSKGMTLLEIMITLAIIAGGTALVLNRFGNDQGRKQKKFVLYFQNLSKQVQSKAKLFNSTYRLALNLDNGLQGEAQQTVWIEKSLEQGVIIEDVSTTVNEDGSANISAAYKLDPSFYEEPLELPEGLFLKDVELSRVKKTFQEGVAYIYFFPQGLVDEAAIHFTVKNSQDKELNWTIYTQPLTGKAYYVGREVRLKELRDR